MLLAVKLVSLFMEVFYSRYRCRCGCQGFPFCRDSIAYREFTLTNRVIFHSGTEFVESKIQSTPPRDICVYWRGPHNVISHWLAKTFFSFV